MIPYRDIKLIAEIASAHEGDRTSLLELINRVALAGADMIKFQVFDTDSFVSSRNSNYQILKRIELDRETWIEAFLLAEEKGLQVVGEPYDIDSLNWLKNLGFVKFLKIPATMLSYPKFLDSVACFEGVVFLGCGGATLSEIQTIFERFANIPVVLTLGFQNFPTSLEDSNLVQITQFKKLFDCDLAYADHIDADNIDYRMVLPLLAGALGVSYVEKHVTLCRSKKGLDYYSSLNSNELRDLKEFLRSLKSLLGTELSDELTEAEYEYRRFSKVSAISTQEIPQGHLVSNRNVCFKRDRELGLSPLDITKNSKIVAKQDICKDRLIDASMVEMF